ncbi:MAG: PKD domain-containing protein [Lewinellaceae bacterium]|nr:PKD domain-containing protein [Lewinellaceae bacterium]
MKPLYLAASFFLLPLCAAAHNTEPANSIDISLSVTHVSCAGAEDGAISVMVSGGSAPYSYTWSTGSTGPVNPGLSPGAYTVTVTDVTGATDTATATVLEADPILLSADVEDPLFLIPGSGKITLNACGGTPQYTYLWSTGGTTKNLTNLHGGVYEVTVVDSKGCTATLPVAVNDPGDTSVFFWLESFDNMRCDTPCAQIILNPQQGVEYDWIGPGGFTSTALSNQLCYPGIYQITAWAGGPNGNSVTNYFVVRPKLPAPPLQIQSSSPTYCTGTSFGSCEQLCPNSTVTYTAVPTNNPCGPIEYTWTITGAVDYTVSATGESVTIQWGDPGGGQIAVRGENEFYCYSSTNKCILVTEEPQAHFAASPAPAPDGVLRVCKGQTVWFDNTSLDATQYEWQFSDDLSGTNAENTQHMFSTPGLFQVALIARNQCFCADTTLLDVEVLDTETPLVECVSTICPGETVTYSTPATCMPFVWTVSANGNIVSGGGPTDPTITVQWLSGPDGTISLAVPTCGANTCPEPAVLRVPVLSDLAKIEGPDRVCPGTEATYTISPFDGTYFSWKILGGSGEILEGQGTNEVQVRWNFPNSISRLIVEYENCYLDCSGSDTLQVRVRPPYGLHGPVELCADATGTVKTVLGTSGALLSNWWTLHGPDGSVVWTSPAHATSVSPTFSAGPGSYRLVAVPDPAVFNNTCSDSAEWTILVAPKPAKPTGIGGPDQYCPGSPTSFSALGIAPQNKAVWSIKNTDANPIAQEGNPANATFTAGDPRWVAARQVSTEGLGCTSDTIRLLLGAAKPLPVSGAPGVCAGAVATYSAPDYPNFDYQWTIIPADAGAISAGQGTHEVEIFWPHAGVFEVQLSICGQQTTHTVEVWALPQPKPQFPEGVCPGDSVVASSAAVFDAYLWKNETGATVGTTNTALVPWGAYALVVTDDRGCRGTAEFFVKEYPKPNLTISTLDPTGFCNNSLFVKMTALTTEDGDFQYEWFQDGLPVGDNTPIYYTNQYGNYTARVTNQYGCSATDGPIRVFEYCGGVCHNPNHAPKCPPGAVDIGIQPLPQCTDFQFNVLAGADYLPGSANWRFGESGASFLGSSTDDNPVFSFPNAGQYIVVLYATLQNGAACTVLDSVKVLAAAQFGQVRSCPGDSTSLKDVSTFLPGTSIVSWQWDFGDPASGAANQSNQRDVKHQYAMAGPYPVSLTVTAVGGCTSTFSENVVVPEFPTLVPVPQTALCAGNATPLAITETADLTFVTWNFDDPASGPLNTASGAEVFHQYAAAGTYAPAVTARNVAGCSLTLDQTLEIFPNLLTGAISPGGISVLCQGQSLLLDAPPVGVFYSWSNGASGQQITVAQTGLYALTVTDAMGCTFSPPAKEVNVLPAPDGAIRALLFNENDQITGIETSALTVCAGETVHLYTNEQANHNYAWSSGGFGGVQEFSEVRNNLLPAGNYLYHITVTNALTGCTAVTQVFPVTVNPVPTGLAVSTDQNCAGTVANVSYDGPQPPGWQYFWNNGATGPGFATTEPGHFFVRVVNEFGCAASSEKVTILPGPNIAALPSGCHRRCEPDSLCLPAMPEIVSWQWFFNGAAIPGATGPNLVATESGAYWAELTDTSGCHAQSVPLTLELFTGTGDVLGSVWSDVNHNGIIDPADTLVGGIPVQLWQNGGIVSGGQSGAGGQFVFGNVPSVGGFVVVDSVALPVGWNIVIGQSPADLVGCAAVAQAQLLLAGPAPCLPTLGTLNATACAGGSFDYNGTAIPAGTSQEFTLQNHLGCDSVLTVTVAEQAVTFGTLSAAACPGSSFDYNGTAIPAGTSQEFILQNYLGCDSVLTVTVAEQAVTFGTLSAAACPGGSFDYNGTAIPAGTSQEFTLLNHLGCDSVLTVTVAEQAVTFGTLSAAACPGGSFDYNGTAIPAGTSQEFTLQNYLGCDSVLTVTVAEQAVTFGTLSAAACPGSSFDYNGTAIPAGTSQEFTLQNYLGCDSVLTVTVAEQAVTFGTLSAAACPGGSFDYNGTAVPAGTSQEFTLQNYLGCDSVLTVTVAEQAAIQFSLTTEKSCADNPTGSVSVQNLSGGLLPLEFSLDGLLFQQVPVFEDLSAGTHQLRVQDDAGCTAEQTFFIEAIPVPEFELPSPVLLTCDGTPVAVQPTLTSVATDISYLWWNGSTEAVVQVVQAGPIWLEITNTCGSIRKNTEVVWGTGTGDTTLAYLPNVFMPGARDAQNDKFQPMFVPEVTVLEYLLEVYDRWGNLVFRTQRLEEGWTGSARGQAGMPGSYVWRLEVRALHCGQEIEIRKNGSVALVR